MQKREYLQSQVVLSSLTAIARIKAKVRWELSSGVKGVLMRQIPRLKADDTGRVGAL